MFILGKDKIRKFGLLLPLWAYLLDLKRGNTAEFLVLTATCSEKCRYLYGYTYHGSRASYTIWHWKECPWHLPGLECKGVETAWTEDRVHWEKDAGLLLCLEWDISTLKRQNYDLSPAQMILGLAFAGKTTEKYSSKEETRHSKTRMGPETMLHEKCGMSGTQTRLQECQRLMKRNRRGKRHKSKEKTRFQEE